MKLLGKARKICLLNLTLYIDMVPYGWKWAWLEMGMVGNGHGWKWAWLEMGMVGNGHG